MSEQLTGRELDAVVAERCFDVEIPDSFWLVPDGITALSIVPAYSKDMAAAWQVVEWIREKTGHFSLTWDAYYQEWECTYAENEYGESQFINADTAPEAICKAALELAKREAEAQ